MSPISVISLVRSGPAGVAEAVSIFLEVREAHAAAAAKTAHAQVALPLEVQDFVRGGNFINVRAAKVGPGRSSLRTVQGFFVSWFFRIDSTARQLDFPGFG